MSGKEIFWACVIAYYVIAVMIVITKFCILPAIRRHRRNRAIKRGFVAYKRYLMRQNLKSFNY